VGLTCLPVTGSVPRVGRARHPFALGSFLIELSVRSRAASWWSSGCVLSWFGLPSEVSGLEVAGRACAGEPFVRGPFGDLVVRRDCTPDAKAVPLAVAMGLSSELGDLGVEAVRVSTPSGPLGGGC
jgi:hypothetical protein